MTELTLSTLLLLKPLTVFNLVVAALFLFKTAAVFLALFAAKLLFCCYEKKMLFEKSSCFAFRGLPGADC